jgi:HSP20 family molecular chaperone IbpA|uniref:Hsp20/alpha crystallin family protein n=1 Tax=Ignisphaera aggregans TaxID=334771 RepID=A0A7J2U019_9CREN
MDEDFERLFKRIKEIERNLREYIEDEFRRAIGKFREDMMHIEGMLAPMWHYEGYLRPLYSIVDKGSYYEIYIDLPKADEQSIDIRFRGNMMYVRARLKEEIGFSGLSGRGGETKFHEYREVVELPFNIDPQKVRVVAKRGFVKVLIYK